MHLQIGLCYKNVFFIVYCRFYWPIDSKNCDFLMCLTELQVFILCLTWTLAQLQASDEYQKSMKDVSHMQAGYVIQFND